MQRHNHYEAAFEAYLRDRRLTYMAIDEAKRVTIDDDPVKSIDFVVHPRGGPALLVDVKGRRVPPRGAWQNWVMRDDIDGMGRWVIRHGAGTRGLFAFAYLLDRSAELPLGTPDVWFWKGRRYLLRAIDVADYAAHATRRSRGWNTVHLPAATFRALIRPFAEFAGIATRRLDGRTPYLQGAK